VATADDKYPRDWIHCEKAHNYRPFHLSAFSKAISICMEPGAFHLGFHIFASFLDTIVSCARVFRFPRTGDLSAPPHRITATPIHPLVARFDRVPPSVHRYLFGVVVRTFHFAYIDGVSSVYHGICSSMHRLYKAYLQVFQDRAFCSSSFLRLVGVAGQPFFRHSLSSGCSLSLHMYCIVSLFRSFVDKLC
jgi:hypothetical protein